MKRLLTRWLLFVLFVVLVSCTFDTAGVHRAIDATSTPDSRADTGSIDARSDGGDAVDGSIDVRDDLPEDLPGDLPEDLPEDLEPVEASVDLPPVDIAVDAPVDIAVDAPTPPSCDDTFGDIAGYKPCEQTTEHCVFYFTDNDCETLCSDRNATCLRAASDVNDTCTEGGTTSCAHHHGDGLCTCSR